MGFLTEDHNEPHSTPKLTLSKLPFCKPRDQPPRHMQTPPLRPSVSIPFHWEEVPGKPRAAEGGGGPPPSFPTTPPSSRSKAARCLELPPRLLHEDAKFTMTSSPTTVLDGPYVGRSLSLACTFSFRKGPAPAKRSDGDGGAANLGSRRWGSFRDERKIRRESLGFSRSLGDMLMSEDNVKMTRVRRRRSFFSLSTIKSKYLWGDIYASFKQAVPWRRSP